MRIDWILEEKNKPHVRQAAEITRLARDCLHKAERKPADVAAKEIEKAVAYIEEIDKLLEKERFEYYFEEFYWYHRTDNDISLNVDVYHRAVVIMYELRNYDLTEKYAYRGRHLALNSDKNADMLYAKDFEYYINDVREIRRKSSPQYIAAEKLKKKKENTTKLFTAFFWVFRILFIVGTVLGGGLATSEKYFPAARAVFLLIIGALACFYMLSSRDFETWVRPVILAPFGYLLIVLVYYVMGHGYKTHTFTFVLGQFGLAVLVIAVGYLIGYIINKARNR